MKLENNVTTESFEMKNYKLQNYDRMTDVIGELLPLLEAGVVH